METVLERPEAQTKQPSQARVATALAGSLALHPRVEQPAESGTIYPKPFGKVILSEIPQQILSKNRLQDRATICPASFDDPEKLGEPKIKLKDGSEIFYYDIFGQQTDEFEPEPLRDGQGNPLIDPHPETRLIIVRTEDGTRYTVAEPYTNPMTNYSGDAHRFTQALNLDILQEPGGKQFLETLGYMFVNDLTYAPSPETFKAFCAKQGIEVEIFKDKSKLEHSEYLEAYANGRYPIGALDAFYSHDIQDDHITALLIGGSDLQKALANSVNSILENKEQTPEDLCIVIDSFTANFRAALLLHGTQGYAYSKEEARKTLMSFCKTLHISIEEMNDLISTAQQRARDLGLEPKEID